MTDQEAFDKILAHARAQGRQALVTDESAPFVGCMYRHPDGLKCFVGALIPDAEYDQNMEDKRVEVLVRDFDPPSLRGLCRPLLMDLQRIHDGCRPVDWELGLAGVANAYGLTYTPPAGTV